MAITSLQIQELYVAYYGRPADPVGLQFWQTSADAATAAGQSDDAVLLSISNSFGSNAEYVANFAGLTSVGIVNQVYLNLFSHSPDPSGLVYWASKLENGDLTLAQIVRAVSESAVNANNVDGVAYTSKVAAAAAFTEALDTTVEILGYSGATAGTLAKAYISGINSAETLATAIQTAALTATVTSVTDAGNAVAAQTFTLTTGVDAFTGGAGNDTFNATNTGATQSLSSFDTIKGGAGADTLNVLSVGNAFDDTTTSSLTVSGIETAVVTSDRKVVLNASTWTDLANLTVVSAGATSGSTSVKAAATTAVTVTNTSAGGNSTVVNGGSTVNVTATDASGGGTITVGNTNAPTGAINITSNNTANGATTGSINIKGGSSVTITQAQFNSANTTNTNGTVNVVGSTATTTVTVNNAAKATASATVAGVNANSVSINDVNGGSASTVAGTITSATVSNFTTLGITDNALASLTVAGGSGNIIIDNSSTLATVTNKTLALNINGQTGGTLDDADIYTTLNVTTTGASSTLANITTGAVTALTVAGTKGLTLTSTAGLTALKTATVSGSAGLTADLSAATVTSVDTSATTGASKVTVDASKATFTGGAGADTVTTTAATVSKAISLGAGDDSLTLGGAAAPTAAIAGGEGTDSISMGAALAATASGSATFAGLVTGFESLVLTGATNQTIDLAVLGNFNKVTTSGGNGLTLSNLPNGGTLVLNGAGTAYTIGNSAFTAGTSDVVNLGLTDGSSAGVAFASTGITASGVETFNISVTDTQATPSGTFNDSVTLLGNSVKAIAVTGNAGLTLTSTSTALTSVDASGITLGGFTWTSGALAAASTVKGSATGINTVDASAATGGAVTYTGGTGADAFTATNGKGNTVTLGDGANTVIVSSGNNTITGGKDADTVTATTGNNTVSLGNGANAFTATSGNNTYTGGTGVDTVTVGGGSNTLTLGTGADKVSITAASANVNTYSTITDAGAGDTITFTNSGTETFVTAKVTLASTAVFQDYANAVVQAGGNASVNGAFGWFQFSGDTYLVQSRHDGSGNNASFANGTDMIVKLTGLVDLSTATGAATGTLTLV